MSEPVKVERTGSSGRSYPDVAYDSVDALNERWGGRGWESQEEIDDGLRNWPDVTFAIQTPKYHISTWAANGLLDEGLRNNGYTPQPGRTVDGNRMYYTDTGPGATGSGAAANLDVDFKGSPWKMPEVNEERFKLENVLKMGFLPGLRPGHPTNQAPYGGIVHHPSRYSTIRVMSIDGSCVYATTNFMLEGIQRVVEEDYRPSRGFEENLLQLHGEKFKLYSLKLKMIDSANFDWMRGWDRAWQRYMRASVLAENKWRFYILSGAKMYGGYPLKYSDTSSAADEPCADLSVVMFVTDDVPLPVMVRLVNKEGMEYFKWSKEGAVFVSGEVSDLRAPEFNDPSEPIQAKNAGEAEVENPPLPEGGEFENGA